MKEMLYKDLDTGEIWEEFEIKDTFEAFREDSDYMNQFESFKDYIDSQIRMGCLDPLE